MRGRRWIAAALALLATPLAACSGHQPVPTFTGVRTKILDSTAPACALHVRGSNGDLTEHSTRGAVLAGPHYTLGLECIGVGTTLGVDEAEELHMSQLRAPRGHQLLVAVVDPDNTYAAYGKGHVDVSVTVAGHATPMPGLPLRAEAYGAAASHTVVIVVSAPRHAPVRLRAADAGRSAALDLRTGKVVADSFRIRQTDTVTWSGSTRVRFDEYVPEWGYAAPVPGKLSVGAADATAGPEVSSLTSYQPGIGWAPKGSAILVVPAPGVSVTSNARTGFLYLDVSERFSDRSVFTFRTNGGRTVHAQPYRRSLSLGTGSISGDDPPLEFVVPAGALAGTVTMDLAKARLVEDDNGSTTNLSWTRTPAPFRLKVVLTS